MARPVIGIALGGGAARGWAHIGVLKALMDAGLEPDIVAGTSIGAVAGACYVTGRLQALEDFAAALTPRRVFGFLDINFAGSGLITGQRLSSRLENHLQDVTIEGLERKFVAVATELGTGHEVWLNKGSLVNALQASFALPGMVFFVWSYVLAVTGMIPRYRFQVPTVDGPSTQPKAAPTIILILLGVAGFIGSRRFLGYFRPRESRPVTEMAKLCTGYLSLLLGMILIISRSPFLVLPCLTAAWAWPLSTCFAEPVYSGALWRHRLTTNAPLLLFGLVAPVALYAYVAFGHGVGWWKAWWYLLVQMVSGIYGIRGAMAVAFLLTAFALLLGVKRMRVVPIETLEAKDDLSMLEPPVPRSRRRPHTETHPPLSPWG